MHRTFTLLFFLINLLFHHSNATVSGTVELDEITFNKVIKKFDAALVKFDVAFPFGEKHDAYVALSADAKDTEELLIAEVGIKDYGEKDNEALGKKYGANKENYPLVVLFVKGRSEPYKFDDKNGFTSDELRKFITEKTGIYLRLPGCIKELDVLVPKFMKASKDGKEKLLKKVEELQKDLDAEHARSGKVYFKLMEKIIANDDKYVKQEMERVQKLLKTKLSADKKKELNQRINILGVFQTQPKIDKKEEL